MKKYKHACIRGLLFDDHEENEYLQGMGEQGWELVSVLADENLKDYYWKREMIKGVNLDEVIP